MALFPCIYRFFVGILIVGAGVQTLEAQPSCKTFFDPDTVSVTCGDSADLNPVVGAALIGDDFDDSQLDPGWTSNQNVDFTNPCPAPVDGTPYAWMGPSATQPRNLTTAALDVQCGGDICFDFIMSEQSNSSPCEGPDQPDEGVHLQYSTNGGTTWNEIFYFNPDTACCGCGGGCGGSPPSPFVDWDNYCFSVPPAAQTSSTKFRWWQEAGSGDDFDHWGLDNVFIVGSGCGDPDSLIFSYDGGNTYNAYPDRDTTVYTTNDTTYDLFITDSAFTDTCYASAFVNVKKPEPSTFVDDTLICDNDSTTLHASDTCTYTLQMFDSFGTSWSGAEVVVHINNNTLGPFTVNSGGSNTVQFNVVKGDSLTIEYVSGFSDDENTYEVYDGNGTLVFQDGPSPQVGVAYVDSSVSDCGYDFSYPSYSLKWSPDSSVSDAFVDNPIAFPDTTTQYVLTYKNASNSKCNVKDTSTVIVEPWGGNTSISYSSGSYCYDAPDQTVTINGVKGGTFYSSPSGLELDSSTGTIDVQNSAADSSYTVYYKTPGTKCSFTDSVPITIDTNIQADFHYADTTYCETAAPVAPTFVNNGSHGVFTVNDTGLALDSSYGTVDIPASDTGVYWVYNKITPSGSCPADEDSAMIVIENKPEVTAGPDDTICEGDTYTMKGTYSGGASMATWTSFGDGSFSDVNDPGAVYTPGNQDVNNGSVTIMIESDSIKACNVDRDTMELVIKPAPSLDVGPDDTICVNGSDDVMANVSGTASGVDWGTTGDGFFDDDLASSTVYHPGVNDKDSGSVLLYADAQGTGVCPVISDTFELTLQPMADPSFSYPGYSYCKGADSTLVPNIQGDSGGVFTADPPGGLALDSSTGSIDLSKSYADIYDITYTVGEDCPRDTTVKLKVLSQPSTPKPKPFEVCPKGTDQLKVSSQVDSVAWYTNSDADNAVETDTTYKPDASRHEVPGVYTYYVRTYKNGCPSDLGSVDVTVHDFADVVVNTAPDPAKGIKPFDVTFNNGSDKDVVNYTLEFGKGMSEDRYTWTDTTVTYKKKGEYKVLVTGYDTATGCPGSTELTVKVTSEPKAQLPNVFTPNGDGQNEVFAPKLNVPCPEGDKGKGTCWNGIADFQGAIYNRWGNKVYEWSDWNDAWSGENASAGTYYYVIDITGEDGSKKKYKGQVTLMRDEK